MAKIPDMVMESDYKYILQINAALVKRLGGEVILSREEIEDAPELVGDELFLTDEFRIRTRVKK